MLQHHYPHIRNQHQVHQQQQQQYLRYQQQQQQHHQQQNQSRQFNEPETSTPLPSTSTINSLINAERIPSEQALGLNAQEASILNFLRVDAAEKQRDRRLDYLQCSMKGVTASGVKCLSRVEK